MRMDVGFADAMKIVEARDKLYAGEIAELIRLLRRHNLDSWQAQIGDVPAERENEYVAKLYEKQIISRAKEYMETEFISFMKLNHPEIEVGSEECGTLE